MLHRKKIDPRHIAAYIISMLLLIVLLPYVSIKLFPSMIKPQLAAYDGKLPKEVSLYLTKEDRYVSLSFETYIQGVVAAEMPDSFDEEALKAQAVASRTYALGRINAGTQLCDTVHCQAYRSDNIPDKVKKAVKATKEQVLLYDGQLAAHALYFSSSAGPTENSQDVFSGTFPYLVSVDSSYEPGATHKEEKVTLTLDQFAKKMEEAFPKLDFGKISKSTVKIRSRSAGGRVATCRVGKQTVSGADIRSALGLYSARFTLSVKGNRITFTSSGSGHGVGMSQYGADGMAKKGKTYQEILAHYYQGTEVGK